MNPKRMTIQGLIVTAVCVAIAIMAIASLVIFGPNPLASAFGTLALFVASISSLYAFFGWVCWMVCWLTNRSK